MRDLRADLDEIADIRLRRAHDYGPDVQSWQEVVRTLRQKLDT